METLNLIQERSRTLICFPSPRDGFVGLGQFPPNEVQLSSELHTGYQMSWIREWHDRPRCRLCNRRVAVGFPPAAS
jgi:hypothetical protein